MCGALAVVRSVGVLTPAGTGVEALQAHLRAGRPCFVPASGFALPPGRATVVGRVDDALVPPGPLPRTHRLALAAARAAVASLAAPPDAVVLGVTTGGLPATERALRRGDRDPAAYAFHGPDTVTQAVAEAVGCRGVRLTVSTACSSGAAAIAVGRDLLRAGIAERVLAGGVDALCQLTVQGFSLLRICDARGCRPLDAERQGMTVAEGAAFLVLEALAPEALAPHSSRRAADAPQVAVLGAGHTCDAHHPTAPHPQGAGAAEAMRRALADAAVPPEEVGYLNLHGTGTRDNDAAEARAVRAVFGEAPPPLSSTKGVPGHSLAASGAVEAALCAAVLQGGDLPPNVGLVTVDPDLGLAPIVAPRREPVRLVQSNSLGFGGSNVSLVLGTVDRADGAPSPASPRRPRLWVLAAGAITGAGALEQTEAALAQEEPIPQRLPDEALAALLADRPLRRLGRLARLVLAATRDACPEPAQVAGIFYGTGWGAVQETRSFLERLWASDGQFSSPTDFASSVHNAVAGSLAIAYRATGPNLTAVGRRDGFAQALLLAGLLAPSEPSWLVAADAFDPELTPRLEGSGGAAGGDGAAALLVTPDPHPDALAVLELRALSGQLLPGGADRIPDAFAGLLQASEVEAAGPLDRALPECGALPQVPLPSRLALHASLAGPAVALAVRAVAAGRLPAWLASLRSGVSGGFGPGSTALAGRGLLVRSGEALVSVEAP